jgi:hypothetical protein
MGHRPDIVIVRALCEIQNPDAGLIVVLGWGIAVF